MVNDERELTALLEEIITTMAGSFKDAILGCTPNALFTAYTFTQALKVLESELPPSQHFDT
jgi:hypothetical protein